MLHFGGPHRTEDHWRDTGSSFLLLMATSAYVIINASSSTVSPVPRSLHSSQSPHSLLGESVCDGDTLSHGRADEDKEVSRSQ